MTERAVIYLRVSTGKQVEGASLENQQMLCQNWCVNNQVIIDKVLHDDGVSAKTLNRPAIKELTEYIKHNPGKITYLVTYQTDRLTRNAADFYALKLLLSQYGVEYKNVNSSPGKNSASDDLIHGIEAVLAQHENKMKSERVTQNMKRHAQEGYRMSKAPLGLRNVRDVLGHSTVEPIEGVADMVADILRAYSTGSYTIASLIRKAHEWGLRSYNGKELTLQTLSKMLRQPLYAGLDRSSHTDGILVKSSFDGIITPAIFYRNQEILRKNKNTAAKYQQLNPLFPLRKFLTCANCGSPLRGSSPTSASGIASPRYHCTGCKSPSIRTDELHEQFLNLLASLRPNPEIEKLIKSVILKVWKEEISVLTAKSASLNKKLDKLRKSKKLAIEKLILGEISNDEKEEFTQSIETEIQTIKSSLEQIESIAGVKEEAIDYALKFMANAPQIWNNADIDAQIIFQQQVFPEGLNYDLVNNTFGTVKLSPLYTLANIERDPSVKDESLMVIPRGIEPLLPG